jgi:hypothetical protein
MKALGQFDGFTLRQFGRELPERSFRWLGRLIHHVCYEDHDFVA